MTVVIMQPYLYPYLGYFQLVRAADHFVFYDDVGFIKNGWINRNRVLVNGAPSYITVQLRDASPSKRINEVGFTDNRGKLLRTLEMAYKKAPYFDQAWPVIEAPLRMPTERVSELAMASVRSVCDYLGLRTSFSLSSVDHADSVGVGRTQRVLGICRAYGADRYVNAPGGSTLYDSADFTGAGIDLRFIRSKEIRYRQYVEPFVPGLSIIDVLMFNPPQEARAFLDQYELV